MPAYRVRWRRARAGLAVRACARVHVLPAKLRLGTRGSPEPRRWRAERRPEAKLRGQTKSTTTKPGEAAGEAHLDTRKLVVWLIRAGKDRSRRNTAAGGGEWRRNVAGAREEGGVARTEDSGVLRVMSDSSWATEGARALTATRRGSPSPRTMVAAV